VKLVRLQKTKHLHTAMTGTGASRAGGRWNAVGTSMVYCSMSLSLATLEVLVHTKRVSRMLPRYSVIEVEVANKAIERLDLTTLPQDWQGNEPACVALGQAWITSMRSVALQVPSAVTMGEYNVLLNPAHPDFAKRVRIMPPHSAARFDPRVFKASKRT